MEIKKVRLASRGLPELARFYRKLGLAVENSAGSVRVKTVMTELEFEAVADGQPVYHFAFNIPANQLEAAKDALSSKVAFCLPPGQSSPVVEFPAWLARSLYFFDPAGNVVELIARQGIGDGEAGVFNAASFLSVSEIGIAVNEAEMDATSDALVNYFRLAPFARQAPLPGFRAYGDDEGLLILVPAGRPWFPTIVPSAAWPVSLTYVDNNRVYTLEINGVPGKTIVEINPL